MHRGVAGRRETQEPESGSTEEANGPEKQQPAQKPMRSGRFCLHTAQGPSNARRGVLGAATVAVHAAQPEQGAKDAGGRDCVRVGVGLSDGGRGKKEGCL